MDHAIISAYEQMNLHRHVSADDILIEPDLRTKFLALAAQLTATAKESEILRRLITLRKTSKLPKSH